MIKNHILCFVILLLGACGIGPPYDGEALEENAAMDQSFHRFEHDVGGQRVYGVSTGKSCNPAVVFIHGAPGDWKAWGQYLGDADLSDKALMIAIDRPGYGNSTRPADTPSLKQQSQLIIEAVSKDHDGPFLLVGHSYGGPIQVQIAHDYPDKVSRMIMLAAAVDPALHKPRWYHHAGNTFVARAVTPQPLRRAAAEMLSLEDDLVAQKETLGSIKTPSVVIQGGKDWLVPPANADFIKKNFKNADVEIIHLPDQGHFLPWEQYGLIKSEILRGIANMKGC